MADDRQSHGILVVHGRGFKPAPESWRGLACAALRCGFERDAPDRVAMFDNASVDVAWYGDLSAGVLARRGKTYDEAFDLADREKTLAALRQIATRKRFGIRRYDRLPGKSAVAEFVADVGSPILGALGLWRPAVRRACPEFAEYLFGPADYRAAVMERVRQPLEQLLAGNARVAVVAHGTGAVVAWDVLRRQAGTGPSRHVDLFVTLGAPLADARLRRRLAAPADGVSTYPECIAAWCNVSAEDDYLCHDKTVADDYREMLDRGIIGSIADYRVYNHAVRFGRSNPHSSAGYLVHPRVTKILGDWLCDGASPAASNGEPPEAS